MLLEPDKADEVAKSGQKIEFDKKTLDALYKDIQKEIDRLPDNSVESSCTILAQMLLLAKEALRAINLHKTDEVLVSLYDMLKAYYKACEERDKKAQESSGKKD
jgi:hypothetical protein